VVYLTAQVTLTLAGFKPGMTVLAPGSAGRSATRAFNSRGGAGSRQGDLDRRQCGESRQGV
jgi:NADPH:quinone reductase